MTKKVRGRRSSPPPSSSHCCRRNRPALPGLGRGLSENPVTCLYVAHPRTPRVCFGCSIRACLGFCVTRRRRKWLGCLESLSLNAERVSCLGEHAVDVGVQHPPHFWLYTPAWLPERRDEVPLGLICPSGDSFLASPIDRSREIQPAITATNSRERESGTGERGRRDEEPFDWELGIRPQREKQGHKNDVRVVISPPPGKYPLTFSTWNSRASAVSSMNCLAS